MRFGGYVGDPWGADYLTSFPPWLARAGIPPRVLAAVLTLVLGWFVALLLRSVATRVARRIAKQMASWSQSPHQPGASEAAVGAVAYWTPLILAGVAASELLGLPLITQWLGEIVLYLPRLIAAVVIVVFGLLTARAAGHIVARAARRAAIPSVDRVRRAAEISIVAASGVVAVEQLGLEIAFLKAFILIVLAAILGGAALSFGLGSRHVVANMLASHYLQRVYQEGQTIRVGQVEGRILRITEIAVIVDDGTGEVIIPAHRLTEETSTLVLKTEKK